MASLRGLDQNGQETPRLDLVVVGFDPVHHGGILRESPGDLGTDQGVRALNLVSHRLAYVVEKA